VSNKDIGMIKSPLDGLFEGKRQKMIGRCFGEKRISSGGIRSIADIPELGEMLS
jgi:hypothetical protein